MVFRPEDAQLLERLEDESLLDALFAYQLGVAASRFDAAAFPPARAAGLVTLARTLDGGHAVVERALGGDIGALARFVDAGPLVRKPPAMLHHLALLHARAAEALEGFAPDAAANAWTRTLAAWLALGEEQAYLVRLEEAVLGPEKNKIADGSPGATTPERVPFERIVELGRRAESSTRDLAPRGRAALLALAWIDDAIRLAGVSDALGKRARGWAERARNSALDAALAVVAESLDEASARGVLATEGRAVLIRAVDIWTWSGHDEAVEQFAVDKLAVVGWELYRARSWPALRALLDPFRPMIDLLASRIEKDPTKIAYAAPCAQMFVFFADVESDLPRRLAMAERSVAICPTHRNGRLVLAALLCDTATTAMASMTLFTRRDEILRIEAMIARAETLYPRCSNLEDTKKMLERVKRLRISL